MQHGFVTGSGSIFLGQVDEMNHRRVDERSNAALGKLTFFGRDIRRLHMDEIPR
jgi:hypothetical protein